MTSFILLDLNHKISILQYYLYIEIKYAFRKDRNNVKY